MVDNLVLGDQVRVIVGGNTYNGVFLSSTADTLTMVTTATGPVTGLAETVINLTSAIVQKLS